MRLLDQRRRARIPAGWVAGGIMFVLAWVGPLALSDARADVDSRITLGLGAEVGVSRHNALQGDTESSFISEVTIRLRLFRFLGAAFAYNVFPLDQPGELVFTSRFRVTVLLYVLSTRRVSIYVHGGYGAIAMRDLGTFTGDTNSYHAGGGIELYLGRHLALHADYTWLIPGAASIRSAIERRTPSAAAAAAGDTDPDTVESAVEELSEISVTDYLSGSNFQLNFGLRFYI
jgi:hypothetical protein